MNNTATFPNNFDTWTQVLSYNFNSSRSYRFGFQGQEMDDEIKGEGNSVNYTFRMHDPRIGRFFAVDPLTSKYPHYSPYSFSGNKVIHAIELEGLEEYELTNKTNKEGKVIESSLKYDENLKKLNNDKDLYVRTINWEGKVSTGTKNVSEVSYAGGYLKPTKAPKHIFGTKHYYYWRANDFEIRNDLMDAGAKTPRYYMDYGDKYAKRFVNKTRPFLTYQGQKWLDKTLINLQTAMEDKLVNDPKIEFNDNKFYNFAFDSHPKAYEDGGLFDLGPQDLLLIGLTPDTDDLLSPEGLKQAAQIAKDYIEFERKKLGVVF